MPQALLIRVLVPAVEAGVLEEMAHALVSVNSPASVTTGPPAYMDRVPCSCHRTEERVSLTMSTALLSVMSREGDPSLLRLRLLDKIRCASYAIYHQTGKKREAFQR